MSPTRTPIDDRPGARVTPGVKPGVRDGGVSRELFARAKHHESSGTASATRGRRRKAAGKLPANATDLVRLRYRIHRSQREIGRTQVEGDRPCRAQETTRANIPCGTPRLKDYG